MRLGLPLALLLGGCGQPWDASGWPVYGATVEQEAQAREVLDAIPIVAELPARGYIDVVAPGGLDGWCGEARRVTGCAYVNGVAVAAGPADDLRTGALGHELCHAALGPSDATADACAAAVAVVVAERSRGVSVAPVLSSPNPTGTGVSPRDL